MLMTRVGREDSRDPAIEDSGAVLRSHNCGQDPFLGQGRSCVKDMGLLEVRTKTRSSFL